MVNRTVVGENQIPTVHYHHKIFETLRIWALLGQLEETESNETKFSSLNE